MVMVRDMKKFAILNEDHLIRFFKYKTGINDPQIINDCIQEFYFKLFKTKTLENYDEKQGSFDTYVLTFFCWILSYFKNRNFRNKYNAISEVKIQHGNTEETYDIWNLVNNITGPYRIDMSHPLHSIFEEEAENSLQNYFHDFKEYIKRTESKYRAHQMLVFIDGKTDGCKSTDIAGMLGISDNMVKIIKQRVRIKFDLWKKRKPLPKIDTEKY